MLKTKVHGPKTKRNKPENKAEKLLKALDGLKNKPKNKPTDVVENTGTRKNKPKTNRRVSRG
jgi:hypothetical protein